MTGHSRTLAFLDGRPVDRLPVHPIIMRWAARHAGAKYRDFCLDWRVKTAAMLRCAEDFDLDWVTVLSDPWVEAEAFGVRVEYPEDSLPVDAGGRLPDTAAAASLRPFRPAEHARCMNRVREIEEFRRAAGGRLFIVGWVEGPVAEYADLRGVSEAAMDLLDDPDACHRAMDAILESTMAFITLQVEAGADCIGIGDAFCSQIGPALYKQFAFEREQQLIAHIHSLGAKAKLHICGNTAPILDLMIATGADIIDVDHLVPDMGIFAGRLGPGQVFSGKCDPVRVMQDSPPESVIEAICASCAEGAGRVIVSAGCEITPGTSSSNIRAMASAASCASRA